MHERRDRGGARRTSASWSALLLAAAGVALACGDSKSATWIGTQDCSVLIAPEQSAPVEIPPVSTRLDTQLALTSDGFYLQDFLIAPQPIAGFSCEPIPLQVTAHYTPRDETQAPEARPVLARGIVLDPFECRALDGRTYTLSASGQADLRAIFFSMTFSAWLGPGQATLMCTTRFALQQAPDAGVPSGVDTQVPGAGQGGEATPPGDQGTGGTATLPDAGAPDAPDPAGAG